jgi:hypothetical protein
MRITASRLAVLGTLCSALFLAGCEQTLTTASLATKVTETPGFVPGVPKGYQCPLVPNGFDPVGSIYRLDQNGTYWRVKDYSRHPAIASLPGFNRSVDISNYVLSDRQISSAGLSYEVLKTALPGLKAEGAGDLKKDVAVEITVERLKGEVIDDTVADQIVALFQQEITPRPGNKYFLVREAVKAGSVAYRLKKEDVAKLGGQAQIEGLAKAKADVTVRDNNGLLELRQDFPDRITVCVKSAELVISPVVAGAPTRTVALKSADDTSVPAIRKVGH